MGLADPNEDTASDLAVDSYEECMSAFALDPVVIEIRVAVLAVPSEISAVDLGEVVRVQFEEAPNDRLLLLGSGPNLDTHVAILLGREAIRAHRPPGLALRR